MAEYSRDSLWYLMVETTVKFIQAKEIIEGEALFGAVRAKLSL
jgi:hypothetical protein